MNLEKLDMLPANVDRKTPVKTKASGCSFATAGCFYFAIVFDTDSNFFVFAEAGSAVVFLLPAATQKNCRCQAEKSS